MIWAVVGTIAALLALAGGGWLAVRGRERRIGSPEDAAAAADAALAGFSTAGAVIGADGLGALAVDARGRVAVMRRRGKRIAVREVVWSAVRAGAGGIVVDSGDRRLGAVALAGVDALDIRDCGDEATSVAGGLNPPDGGAFDCDGAARPAAGGRSRARLDGVDQLARTAGVDGARHGRQDDNRAFWWMSLARLSALLLLALVGTVAAWRAL